MGVAASAQQPPPPPADASAAPTLALPTRTFTIQVEPVAWYVAPGGNLTLPGSAPGSERVPMADLNLDSPRLSPYVELHLLQDDWRFTLSGFSFSESDRGAVQSSAGQIGDLPFAAGDRLVSSLDFWSAEAEVAWRFVNTAKSPDFHADVEALGGVRVYDVDFHIDGPGGSASGSEFLGHPFVGAKLTMDLIDFFTIDAQIDVGYLSTGKDSVAGYEVVAGFVWRPTPAAALQIGYRDLAFSILGGSGNHKFDYGGALQGLFIGAVFRF
jgi:hypothetical protein